MKNSGRIIALVLLLAIVASVFAVLPTFASTETTGTTTGINTIYDMDSKESINPANSEAGLEVYRDEDGYWVTDFSNYNADQAANKDAWFGLDQDKFPQIVVQDSPVGQYDVYVKDSDGNITGTYQVEGGTGVKRNTKYLVLDFDISTTSTLIENIYFNLRHTDAAAKDYNASYKVMVDTDSDGTAETETTLGSTMSPKAPSIRDNEYSWYANVSDGSATSRYPIQNYHAEWMNVTFVYDYTERVNPDGTVDRSHWAIHVFFDGVYAGQLATINSDAARVWFFRMSFGKPDSEGTTARWKNLTLKQITTDYTGILDNTDIKAINLNDIDVLAYTQENCPEQPLVAEIIRNGVTTPYYSVYDFDSELELGDTLVLYQDINRTYVVQDNGDGADTTGITIVDNGFTAPTLVEMDLENTAWVMRDYYSGAVVASKETYTYRFTVTTTVTAKTTGTITITTRYYEMGADGIPVEYQDALVEDGGTASSIPTSNKYSYAISGCDEAFWSNYSSEANRIITFYDNYLLTTNTGSVSFKGYHVVFDLNGNQLYIAPTVAHIFSTGSTAGRPEFKDGEIYYKPMVTSYNFIFANNNTNGFAILFDNVTLTTASGTWADQRGGMFYYKDCTINANASFMSTKSDAGRYAYAIFDHCAYTDTTTGAITVKNVSNKNNGMSSYIIARNGCTITCPDDNNGNFVISTAYYTADTTVKRNYVNVSIFDSTVEDATRILKHTGSKLTDATDFSLNVDVNLVNSDINTYRVAYVGGNLPTAAHVYDVDIFTLNTKLMLGSAGSFVDRKETASDLTVTIGEGTMLRTTTLVNASATTGTDTVLYGVNGDCKLTNVAEGDFKYICLPESEIVTYTYPTADSTATIEWARDYAVDYSRFTDLKDLATSTSEAYNYEWRIIDNVVTEKVIPTFALRGNLTLYTDLYFNLFIENKYPETFTKENVSVTTSLGALELGKDYVVTDYNDGTTDYFKVQIRGINPNEIDTEYTLVLDFGNDVKAEKTVSTLDYITMMLTNTNEDGTANTDCDGVMASLVDYASAAYTYTEKEIPAALAALKELEQYKAVAKAESTVEAVNTLDTTIFSEVALNLTEEFCFVLTLKDTTKAGEAVTVTVGDTVINTKVLENNTVAFSVKAHDMTETFAVNIGGTDAGTYNLKAYVDAVNLDVADAIWQYVVEATAYKAN